MALSQRLNVRQSQSLVMTPQLQEAIRLLGLSHLELAEYVDREVQDNPLLEHDHEAAERTPAAPGERDAERTAGVAGDQPAPGGAPGPEEANGSMYPEQAGGAGLGAEWPGRASRTGAPAAAPDAVPDTAAGDISLRDHLYQQLGIECPDPVSRLVGAHLIEMLDDNGYIADDPCEITTLLGCSPGDVDAVLARLQGFDPPGVFARSLAECLSLQLRERNLLDQAMRRLLDNLDLLARRDLAKLRRCCGVDDARLAEMVREIRALDPKPGSRFGAVHAQPLVPDILMHPEPDGSWRLELNPAALPKVLVNSGWMQTVAHNSMTAGDRAWLNGCRQSAHWLVRSLEQRATTILRVAREIVRRQDDFFRFGVQRLRPLVLNDIAAALDMHESTISRVTSNKYIATPRGVLELKYFFTSSVRSLSGGEDVSAAAVRDRLRRLIEDEAPDSVLSDDRLVEILRAQGIDIARRTVAKYRELMRIPSSVQRRREKTALP